MAIKDVIYPSNLNAYDGTGKKLHLKAERMELTVEEADALNGQRSKVTKSITTPILLSLMPFVIDIGTSYVKSRLKKTANSYAAAYEAKASKDNFYNHHKVLLPKLVLKRYLFLAGKNQENKSPAATFIFQPELSKDKSVFRYYLAEYQLSNSKAKIHKRYNLLTFSFEFELSASWINSEKSYQNETIGTGSIKIPYLKFSDKKIAPPWMCWSEWFPLVPPRQHEELEETKRKTLFQDLEPGLITYEKRTIGDHQEESTLKERTNDGNEEVITHSTEHKSTKQVISDGTGNYNIKVVVKEANPYGLTAQEISDFFEENQESIAEGIKNIVAKDED